jgi:hypothetical protein
MEPPKKIEDTVVTALNAIDLKVRKLQGGIIKASMRLEKLDGMAMDVKEECDSLARLIAELLAERGLRPAINLTLGPARGGIELTRVARHCSAVERADGGFNVRIDFSAEPIRVPRLAGLLLKFLTSGEPQDGVAGWRTRKEILDHLGSITGQKYADRFASQLAYQLRAYLGEYGCLVQNNRQLGWRFAVKAGEPGHLVRTRLANAPERRAPRPVIRRPGEPVVGTKVRSR